jgi:hypothetical protein
MVFSIQPKLSPPGIMGFRLILAQNINCETLVTKPSKMVFCSRSRVKGAGCYPDFFIFEPSNFYKINIVDYI